MRIFLRQAHEEKQDGGRVTYRAGSWYVVDGELAEQLIAAGKAETEEQYQARISEEGQGTRGKGRGARGAESEVLSADPSKSGQGGAPVEQKDGTVMLPPQTRKLTIAD